MAERPVFVISNSIPYYEEKLISFQYYSGFAEIQKKKSIKSLHEAILKQFPKNKVLEISSKSENELGVKLSAFNLQIKTNRQKEYSVEAAFQASKVFEHGGPYKDLLNKSSREAKKDPRLKESGRLIGFYFGKRCFPIFPTTYFYNWLYINSLHFYPELESQLMDYTAFTDIAFNPDKSINCQARAAAIYVSLQKNNLIQKALEDKDAFLEIVYGDAPSPKVEQLSMWDKL